MGDVVEQALECGFKTLQTARMSLLKQHLTRPLLDNLKHKKTKLESSLLDVVQSGFLNLDSSVGVYAPDVESYTLFAPLFNPIIESYHGSYVQPLTDFGDEEKLINLDPDQKYIKSIRVRCARSLEGFPFNPKLSESQYKDIELIVSRALSQLNGALRGSYHPLVGMSNTTQQQLIDDHYLFKSGDRFLKAANAYRFWPTGRGIYHNHDKTFLVWVNEEDHMRIISMQKGGNLQEVYARLVAGIKALRGKLKCSKDERLGYLTFCPTNLGTTIRASVHITLPMLSSNPKKLAHIAATHNLQVGIFPTVVNYFVCVTYSLHFFRCVELQENTQRSRMVYMIYLIKDVLVLPNMKQLRICKTAFVQ